MVVGSGWKRGCVINADRRAHLCDVEPLKKKVKGDTNQTLAMLAGSVSVQLCAPRGLGCE